MLDIRIIRERPDFVRERLASRGAGDEAKVDELLKQDASRRKRVSQAEQLRSQRNRLSKEVGALMAQKKSEEAETLKKKVREISELLKALEGPTLEEADELIAQEILASL